MPCILTLPQENPALPGVVKGVATWNACVDESDPRVAVTVKSPAPVAESNPADVTDAGAPEETDQAAVEVTSRVEPSLYRLVAVSSSLSPMSSEVPGAETAMPWSVGAGGGEDGGGVTAVDPPPLHENRLAHSTAAVALRRNRNPEWEHR
jgi:hypothetical protein